MENTKELFSALSKAQSEFKTLSKDKDGYGYKYTELSTIVEHVTPILRKHGLFIIQPLCNDGERIGITTMLVHESGEFFSSTVHFPSTTMSGVNNMQAIGATITYGRRYALSSLLGICTEEDSDATQVNTQAFKKQEYKPKSAPLTDGSKYVVNFGKYKGCSLEDIEIDHIESYVAFLTKDKEPKGNALTFVTEAIKYLDSMESEPKKQEQPEMITTDDIPF